jgi:hypothetical protein
MKSSAHTELSGVIVFEPIILKEPERTGVVGLGVEVLLQPARTRAKSSIAARGINHFLVDLCKLFFLLIYLISMASKRFCPSIIRIRDGL